MSTELEQRLRDLVVQMETDVQEITATEVVAASVVSRPVGRLQRRSKRRRTQQWARVGLGAAAAVAVVIAGVIATRGLESPATFQTTPDATTAPAADLDDRSATPVPSPPASPTPTPNTAPTPTPTPTPTTVASVPTVETRPTPTTIDELRTAQAAALSRLTGFLATTAYTNPAAGGDAATRTSQITMLDDGSFWFESDDGSWASYDASTQTEQSSIRRESGEFDDLSLVANGVVLSLSEFVGTDPTALVDAYGDISITATTSDRRPAWLVTSEIAQTIPIDGPTDAAVPATTEATATWTETREWTVDVETGLIVESMSTSDRTDVWSISHRTSLTDLAVVTELPPSFPGRFPAGEAPAPIGNEPRRTVTQDEAADLFGIALPLPELSAPEPTITYDEGGYINGIDSDVIAGVNRIVSLEFREGFNSESVSVSASTPDDPDSLDDYWTVVNGYQCTDSDRDDICDNAPQNYLSYPDGGPLDVETIIIRGGALDGTTAIVNSFGLSLEFGVFLIGVHAATTVRAIEIAESFTLAGER